MNPPLPADPPFPDNAARDRRPDPGGPLPGGDDEELLRDYRTRRDGAAFHALVRRHFPAVQAAARRLVNGDAALAEDISQEVFTHLAIHAGSLPPRVVLGGWLHRHTCFTAAKTLRAALRRRSREQLAAADMNASPHPPPPGSSPWPDIAPHLDAALNALPASDRDAVILRFFENRGFSAIACALNTSEDAARMRTGRALEKLRRLLGKHSGALTAAALAGLLRENSAAAIAGTAASGSAALTVSAASATAATAARIATHALNQAAALPAAGTGAAAGLTAAFRTARPALLGGSALLLAVTAAWKWNAGFASPSGRAAAFTAPGKPGSPAAAAPAAARSEVTVHLLLVPEAEALALMNERWNGDGDTQLLATLLKKAGSAPGGVQVAQILTATLKSGAAATLRQTKDFPARPKYGQNPPRPPGKGESATVEVGAKAMIEATVTDDGQWCDVNFRCSYHFAGPLKHYWPADAAGGPGAGPDTVETMEFREATTDAQALIRLGESSLIQCGQLPALTDGESRPSTLRLLTFVTAQSVSPS